MYVDDVPHTVLSYIGKALRGVKSGVKKCSLGSPIPGHILHCVIDSRCILVLIYTNPNSAILFVSLYRHDR